LLLVSHTTGYQLRAFNDAAERLGVEIVFATDRCHRLDDPWQDRAIPVRFHEIAASLRAIVERAAKMPVDGVMAVGDRPVVLAACAAEALGLDWHDPEGALASTDKRRARRLLSDAGLPSPAFRVHGLDQIIAGGTDWLRRTLPGFPVVVKPVGLSGSRGVIRANDLDEAQAAVWRIRALLGRPQIRAARTGLEDEILIEEYIDGEEFALEGVMTHGRLQTFAIFDKPDPLVGPFFEETIYAAPSRLSDARLRAIADAVGLGAAALGLVHGPIHAETRIARDGRVFVLEIAARPIGGLCSRVLTFSNGMSLEEILIHHAIGDDISGVRRESRGAAVMMIPIPRRGLLKGVSGETDAAAVPGVTEVRITAKPDQLLEPLPEAGSYLGFVFARGATASDAESSVRAAHARLQFDIARDIRVQNSEFRPQKPQPGNAGT
jgi:biotin carboxylase